MKAILKDGIPFDVGSARMLATREDDRTRKEFEKWAVLTYTYNRAVIRAKKGADKGIDDVVYFTGAGEHSERAILQAKSGGVQRKDIATLRGDMERQEAQLGFFAHTRRAIQTDEGGSSAKWHVSAPTTWQSHEQDSDCHREGNARRGQTYGIADDKARYQASTKHEAANA
ncbi:MAG: restriction endonuclease [Bryobacteraceae bacterium]